ncbi:hypothetical protein RSOL_045890, partial [Rhizoctonia solani AG-3 Rhs1AP]
MPTQPNRDSSSELAISKLRKATLIGTFTVLLRQTRNHPDQRALDRVWVDELAKRIGAPEVLNRALHPISVILEDNTWNDALLHLLGEKGKDSAPNLPDGVDVLVFAGQHRLAMLLELDLGGPDQLWWHAQVYKKDERVNRAICNLTRNEELMDTIADALSRVHIANVFSAGSWMRITTGRLYMVAVGLIREMTTQVDQLTEGMSEVPDEVLTLQPRVCLVSKIGGHGSKRKSRSHAWDILPGGREAALGRAILRPPNFVTRLNPKKDDPWSLPHMVLLPSCLGSRLVEDELKLMQTVTNHVLKMITTEEEFNNYYNKGNPETLEGATDHPAGMIAHFINKKHPNDPNVLSYEYKILHAVWASRAKLHEQLEEQNIPSVESTDENHYQRLIETSKDWWGVMRLFKVSRLHSRFKLTISKEFKSGTSALDTIGTNDQAAQKHRPIPMSHNLDMVMEDESVLDDVLTDPYLSEEENENANYTSTKERKGGDRRLANVMDQMKGAMDSMTRNESRAMTELLEQILASRENSEMEHMVKGLVSKGKRIMSKLETLRQVDYDSSTEIPGGGSDGGD